MINLTPFPIRIGAPDAEEIPSSGVAKVVGLSGAATIVEVAGREIVAKHYAKAADIVGLHNPDHDGKDIIVPLTVAAAMRELDVQHHGRVFTPGMLREEGGVKYAPDLIRHPDLEMVMRGGLTF